MMSKCLRRDVCMLNESSWTMRCIFQRYALKTILSVTFIFVLFIGMLLYAIHKYTTLNLHAIWKYVSSLMFQITSSLGLDKYSKIDDRFTFLHTEYNELRIEYENLQKNLARAQSQNAIHFENFGEHQQFLQKLQEKHVELGIELQNYQAQHDQQINVLKERIERLQQEQKLILQQLEVQYKQDDSMLEQQHKEQQETQHNVLQQQQELLQQLLQQQQEQHFFHKEHHQLFQQQQDQQLQQHQMIIQQQQQLLQQQVEQQQQLLQKQLEQQQQKIEHQCEFLKQQKELQEKEEQLQQKQLVAHPYLKMSMTQSNMAYNRQISDTMCTANKCHRNVTYCEDLLRVRLRDMEIITAALRREIQDVKKERDMWNQLRKEKRFLGWQIEILSREHCESLKQMSSIQSEAKSVKKDLQKAKENYDKTVKKLEATKRGERTLLLEKKSLSRQLVSTNKELAEFQALYNNFMGKWNQRYITNIECDLPHLNLQNESQRSINVDNNLQDNFLSFKATGDSTNALLQRSVDTQITENSFRYLRKSVSTQANESHNKCLQPSDSSDVGINAIEHRRNSTGATALNISKEKLKIESSSRLKDSNTQKDICPNINDDSQEISITGGINKGSNKNVRYPTRSREIHMKNQRCIKPNSFEGTKQKQHAKDQKRKENSFHNILYTNRQTHTSRSSLKHLFKRNSSSLNTGYVKYKLKEVDQCLSDYCTAVSSSPMSNSCEKKTSKMVLDIRKSVTEIYHNTFTDKSNVLSLSQGESTDSDGCNTSVSNPEFVQVQIPPEGHDNVLKGILKETTECIEDITYVDCTEELQNEASGITDSSHEIVQSEESSSTGCSRQSCSLSCALCKLCCNSDSEHTDCCTCSTCSNTGEEMNPSNATSERDPDEDAQNIADSILIDAALERTIEEFARETGSTETIGTQHFLSNSPVFHKFLRNMNEEP